MSRKAYAIIGMLSMAIFSVAYAVMSGVRSDYSFLTKAISELGSVDAPNKWVWNLFGYIVPGILIAVFSIGLFNDVSQGKGSKWPLIGFTVSGLLMSLSGVFPGDFDNRESATMLWHTVGSFGSYLFFLLGAFTYPALMKKSEYWKRSVTPTLVLTWLTIFFGSWPFVVQSYPAVGQRLVFFFYFLWFVFMAVRLYQKPANS